MTRMAAAAVVLSLAFTSHAIAQGVSNEKPEEISWQEIHDAILDQFSLAREGQNRWSLALAEKSTAPGKSTAALQDLARETIEAAYVHISWIVTEITYKRFVLPGVSMRVGTVVDLPNTYGRALLKAGSIADPLRRYADAACRARGLVCGDCLSGLRESRDVLWIQVREYLERFIFIKNVGMDQTVDLRVGRVENRLPHISSTDQDLAAAVFAHMQPIVKQSRKFQNFIQQVLNEELRLVTNMTPLLARYALNNKVPPRILENPEIVSIFAEGLSKTLDIHGLRCTDCPMP